MDNNRPTVFFGEDRLPVRRWQWRRPTKQMLIITAVAIALLIAGVTAFVLTRKRTELPSSAPTVEITNEGFNPVVIKIKKGDRVQWVNKDVQLHQIAADPHPTSELLPSLKSTEPLVQEEVYSAVFEKSGTYTYHDFLDPLGFQATVIVE